MLAVLLQQECGILGSHACNVGNTFLVISYFPPLLLFAYGWNGVDKANLFKYVAVFASVALLCPGLCGVLFVDGKRSTPVLDYTALQQASLAAGDTMRVEVTDASGKLQGDFAVLIVDGVPDVPATGVHHWELGLV